MKFKTSDKYFYVSLFPEQGPDRCRAQSCNRLTVKNSAMCAKHHFEMIKRKPCPWEECPVLTPEEQALLEQENNAESSAPAARSSPAMAGMGIGCLAVSVAFVIAGIALLVFRSPNWRIPGIACFILIALGLAGIKTGWQALDTERHLKKPLAGRKPDAAPPSAGDSETRGTGQ